MKENGGQKDWVSMQNDWVPMMEDGVPIKECQSQSDTIPKLSKVNRFSSG